MPIFAISLKKVLLFTA